MSKPLHQANGCDYGAAGPIPLATAVRYRQRAAFIGKVVSIGSPVWNSPDGRRWTQAQLNQGVFAAPSLFMPYAFLVQRVYPSSVASIRVGQVVKGYLQGGTTAFGDVVQGCIPPPAVNVGATAVVLLAGEIDTGIGGNAPLHRPTIVEFDPIVDGVAMTMQGAEPIP
jgi:hypothetical protein